MTLKLALFLSLSITQSAHTESMLRPELVGQSGCLAVYNLMHEQRKDGMRVIAAIIDGARISSPFGWRISPILQLREFHGGTDIAANAGSPIRAVIAGVVEEAARKGTYGLYLRIRHSLEYETAYAHLSAFAENVHPDVMLQPGDVLGLVGSSGLSTGNHLHYELWFRGKPVDPICRSPVVATKPAPQPKVQAPLRVRAARKSRKRK